MRSLCRAPWRILRLFWPVTFIIGILLLPACAPRAGIPAQNSQDRYHPEERVFQTSLAQLSEAASASPDIQAGSPGNSAVEPPARMVFAAARQPARNVEISEPQSTPSILWFAPVGGQVTAPILVYHHIINQVKGSRYALPVDVFRQQMQALSERGYTAVTQRQLSEALRGQGLLPPKPVVITFDDGDLDVYQNAFPVMQALDYPGVFFVLSSALQDQEHTSPAQLREMIESGWEIGSHSATHADLQREDANLNDEIYDSRLALERVLDTPVVSFAYPFGSVNARVMAKTSRYGYTSAGCIGWSNIQRQDNLFCLSRREVQGNFSLEDFLALLEEK